MARARMVTRTVSVTTATFMGLDVLTAEVKTFDLIMTGYNLTAESALKIAKKQHETADFKVVACTNISTDDILYGMPEEEFVKLAKVLPPRTVTEE